MVNKIKPVSLKKLSILKSFRQILIFVLLAFMAFANAQNATQSQNEKFVQKIQWEKDEYALRYQIEIELVQSNGRNVQVLKQTTTDAELTLSLPAGNYRYKITKYDFLERPVTNSNWIALEIIKAIQPIITNIEPQTLYYSNGEKPLLKISGEGFLPESQLTFESRNKSKNPEPKLVSTDENGNLIVEFDEASMKDAEYTITIKNPGNLFAINTSFATKKAVQPVIESVSVSQIVLLKGQNAVFTAEGTGFDNTTSFEFISSDEKLKIQASATVETKGRKTTATISVVSPRADSYRLFAQNAGGLSDNSPVISVRHTTMPQLSNATSGKYSFKKNESLTIIMDATGLQDDSLFYLIEQTKAEQGKISISEHGAVPCRSYQIRPDGLVEVLFSAADFSNTVYTAVVENPGNLTSYSGRQEITVIPASDISISGGVFVGQKLYNDTLFDYTDKDYLSGISADLAIIPIKSTIGYFGIDLSFLGTTQFKKETLAYDLTMQLFASHFNFLFQHPFFVEKVRLTVHGGPGLTFLSKSMDYSSAYFGTHEGKEYAAFLSGQVGTFISFYPINNFFVEAGFDFVHIFASDMPTGIIFPAIRAGLRL